MYFYLKILLLKKIKNSWEIDKNWQFIHLLLGILALLYSAYKLALVFTKDQHIIVIILSSLVVFFILRFLVLKIFKKLRVKWNVKHRWELVPIFLVFAATGSSSAFIGKPILNFLNITTLNFGAFGYWAIRILLLFVVYQILLVCFGWVFGQYEFFWNFEKKMLRRLRLIKNK